MNRKFWTTLTLIVSIMAVAGVTALAGDSQNLQLHNSATLNGVELKAGNYKVSWEASRPEVAGPTNVSMKSGHPEVTVTIKKGRDVVTTAQGKLVNRDADYNRDAIIYRTNPDGSMTVTELRFRNMKQVIVFE